MDEVYSHGVEGAIAGYRLVRRLALGSQSEVFLGQCPADAPAAPAPVRPANALPSECLPPVAVPGDEGPHTAALKVFRAEADGRSIDRQVRALLAVPPGAFVRLSDVATAPDGRPCLVLDRLPGPSLASLLEDRGRIRPGEAVTILATVITALQALHEAGYSHPALGPACVRFDGSGRPILLSLGALLDIPAGAAGVARKRDDLVRLHGCARSVLDRVQARAGEGRDTAAVLAVFEGVATMRPFPADLTGLETALFAWAPATAVDGAASQSGDGAPGVLMPGSSEAAQNRVVRDRPVTVAAGQAEVERQATGARPAADPVRTASRVGSARFTRALTNQTRGAHARLRARVAGLRQAARRVSGLARIPGKPVVAGLGLAVLLVAGALALLGPVGSPADTAAGTASAGGTPVNTTPTSATVIDPAGVPAPSIEGDDPAAAVLDLLRLRDKCLAESSLLCLTGVDQAGSVIMAADSFLVREEQASGVPRAETSSSSGGLAATVQERTGDAALVVLSRAGGEGEYTQPASALVIKGEAGWRLRELFDR